MVYRVVNSEMECLKYEEGITTFIKVCGSNFSLDKIKILLEGKEDNYFIIRVSYETRNEIEKLFNSYHRSKDLTEKEKIKKQILKYSITE